MTMQFPRVTCFRSLSSPLLRHPSKQEEKSEAIGGRRRTTETIHPSLLLIPSPNNKQTRSHEERSGDNGVLSMRVNSTSAHQRNKRGATRPTLLHHRQSFSASVVVPSSCCFAPPSHDQHQEWQQQRPNVTGRHQNRIQTPFHDEHHGLYALVSFHSPGNQTAATDTEHRGAAHALCRQRRAHGRLWCHGQFCHDSSRTVH